MSLAINRAPTISPEVRFCDVGGDRIVQVAGTSKVVQLNRTARAILGLCDGERSAGEICRILAEKANVPPGKMFADVAAVLGRLAADHLIEVDGSILEDLALAATRSMLVTSLRFGEHSLRVQMTDKIVAAELKGRFRRLMVRPDDGETMNLDIISMRGVSGEYAYVHTGCGISQGQRRRLSAVGDLDFLKAAIVNPFVLLNGQYDWFHAGAVARGGRAVVIVGPSGSGKSSLTAEFCRRGWEYLSDEVVPIDRATLVAVPFPLTPITRQRNQETLPDHRLREIRRYYFEVPDDRVCGGPVEPYAVVVPTFMSGRGLSLRSDDAGAAARELLRSCLSLPRSGGEAIESVARLVERVKSVSLRYDDVATACDELEAILSNGS